MRLRWTDASLTDLEDLAGRAPVQAVAVYRAASWLASQRFARVGRPIPGTKDRFWPVPPHQAIIYRVEADELFILRVTDTRGVWRSG